MTKKKMKRPAMRNKPSHVIRQMFNGWPWIVWLLCGLTVLVLLPGGLNRVRFHGVSERTYEYISPLEDGRLKVLHVAMGDRVEAGQLIGELDNASLAAEMLMDQASLMKTRDKVFSIRCEIEALRLEEAKVAAELSSLESQQARNEDLLKRNLVREQDVEDLNPQIVATREILKRYPLMIATVEERLKGAEADSELLSEEKLRELQESQCRLVAKTAGVVAEVFHQPGNVIETGDPILRISNVDATRVIAFVSEEKQVSVREGEPCRVISNINRASYKGRIKTVTADIRKLPVFTGFGDQILRGRRIVVDLEDGATLLPGEQVMVVPSSTIIDQWFRRKL